MQVTLKGVVWSAVVTIATTVLGKIVESVFDVSLISPYIVGLWSWVKAAWSWLGNEVSMPVWASLILCLLSFLSLTIIGMLVYENWFGKPEEAPKEAPKGAPLTEDQLSAFAVIGRVIQKGHRVRLDEVQRYCGLSVIATQNALEHLFQVGLIKSKPSDYGSPYADLTSLGRQHYLDLEKQFGWEAD